jgi:Bacterial Ig-like domain/Calcineurin-like phosphoesterase
MASSKQFRTVLMRRRAARYATCVVLACVAAVLMAVPIFAQTVTVTLVGAGDIARCDLTYDEATAQLLGSTLRSLTPDGTLPPPDQARVITMGDNAYSSGTRAQFANCYDNYRLSDYSIYDSSRRAWWGKYKDLTMPTLGNHEYLNSTDPALKSKPYFDYFSAQNGFLPPKAPVPNTQDNPGLTKGKGYYSYDLGSWHIVALNSNDHCAYVSCADGSEQANWLRDDLATHPAQCTLAYIHHPLYATGTGGVAPEVKPLVQILYDRGADVMLNGHNHRYERLARIDPNGNLDPVNGIRMITAGTGGDPGEGNTTATPPVSSEVRIFGTAGVIKMDLSNDSYSWNFVAVDGTANGTVKDSGSESCHGAPGSADTTAPTVTTVSPADGATRVPFGTSVTATFSEAMDPATLTTSTFILVKEGTTTPISATVNYDATTKQATLKPTKRLAASTKYTATVKGGAGGTKDLAGNPLAADKVWSFTTKRGG